ncbi:unnamed protein product, partial [Ceratitis capitata]
YQARLEAWNVVEQLLAIAYLEYTIRSLYGTYAELHNYTLALFIPADTYLMDVGVYSSNE